MVLLTNFPPPSEGVKHKQEVTEANVQGKSLGSGTLYIAESCVAWFNSGGEGFSLQYPAISLHAVSRDVNAFPKECLYLMVDGSVQDVLGGEPKDGGSDSEDEDSENKVAEIRFIPEDNRILDNMYQAMVNCQVLHPDPDDSFSDDGNDDFYGDEEGAENLTSQGQATLDRLDAMFSSGDAGTDPVPNGNGQTMETGEEDMETGQFEDAEGD